jgi:transcriptional regulator with XRE-family HTH domain
MAGEAKRPGTETIGGRLRRLRLERGMSQRQLAGAGISAAHVSRIERGLRQPPLETLRTLAARLKVSPAFLETGEPAEMREQLELRLMDAELELRVSPASPELLDALRSVVAEARRLGDIELAMRATAVLGIALSASASYGEALPLLEEAAISGLLSPLLRPDLYTTLARAQVAAGEVDEAVGLLRLCLKKVGEEAPRQAGTHMHYAIHLSLTLTDAGQLGDARKVMQKAVALHGGSCDRHARALTYWTLARIAAMDGDSRLALSQMRKAIGLLEASEDTLELAKAHGLYAQILVMEERYQEAREPLARASRLFELEGQLEDAGHFLSDEAKCAVALGDADEAIRLARRALDLLRDSPREQGGALGALATAHAARGERGLAAPLFAEAVDRLERASEFAEAGRVCRAWAQMLEEAEPREASVILERASRLQAEGATTSHEPLA